MNNLPNPSDENVIDQLEQWPVIGILTMPPKEEGEFPLG